MALVVKKLPVKIRDARDSGSVPELGKYPGVGNGNPLQYSCLEKSHGQRAWGTIVHRVANSWIRLSDWAHKVLRGELPGGWAGKESACNAGDPGSGRSPGEGIGHPLRYFCASLVTQLVKNSPAKKKKKRINLQCGRPGFNPWVGKISWRRERLPTPVFWPGEFHGLYSPWGHKESDLTEWLSHSEVQETDIIQRKVKIKSYFLFATKLWSH